MIVDLFIPCYIDQMYPQLGMKMVKIFEKLDIGVNYNTDQTCCGQIAYNTGYFDEARCLGEKFIKNFSNNRYVVSPSASCVAMVKNYYQQMFQNTSMHISFRQLQKNIFEFSDFIINVLNKTNLNAYFPEKVTFHDGCSALRECGIKEQPRQLLKKVKGLDLVEMEDSEVCCGFGGTFSIKNTAISTAMVEQKVKNAINSGAKYITSTEVSCLMNIESYIKKNNSPIKSIHIIDILSENKE